MYKIITLIAIFVPVLAYAQVPRDAFGVITLVSSWITRIVPVLLGFIMIVIFWNLSQFVLHAGEERERDRYKQFMIWSVVAMFLILSFWGIVYAITRSFFGNLSNPILTNPGYMDRSGRPL